MSNYNNESSCADRIGRFLVLLLLLACMRMCRAAMREADRPPRSSSSYSVVEPRPIAPEAPELDFFATADR